METIQIVINDKNFFGTLLTSIKNKSDRISEFVSSHKTELFYAGLTLGMASYAPISAVVYCSAGFLMGLSMDTINAKKGLLDHCPLPTKGTYLLNTVFLIAFSVFSGFSPGSAGLVLGGILESHVVHYCIKPQNSDSSSEKKLSPCEQTRNKISFFICEHKTELFFTAIASTSMIIYPKIFFRAIPLILLPFSISYTEDFLKKEKETTRQDLEFIKKYPKHYAKEIERGNTTIQLYDMMIKIMNKITKDRLRKSAYACALISSIAFVALNKLVKPVSPDFSSITFISIIYGTVISKMLFQLINYYYNNNNNAENLDDNDEIDSEKFMKLLKKMF
jgi:hypothetical protein